MNRVNLTKDQVNFLLTSNLRGLTPSVAKGLNNDDGYEAFKELRWGWSGGTTYCPRCFHERLYEFANRDKFKCAKCGRQFSVTSGTPFRSRKCPHKIYISAMSFKIHTPSTVTDLGAFLGVNYRTAWRLNGILGLLRGNIVPKTAEAQWPYNAPEKVEGSDLVSAVNAALPKRIPEQVRADVSQEMILGILEGDISLDDVKNQVGSYLKRFWGHYDWDRVTLSLDQSLGGHDFGSRYDLIAAE